QLDLMSLIAGASHRGEFEERLKNLIKEVKAASGSIILFIDEIHNMVGAGSGDEGTMDASNILKPSLARGELQTIGTTTITEYRKYIEKDPALERRFQPVQILEPTEDAAIEMLHALRDKYEAFHKVSIPDEAIDAAVHLSKRYVGDRFLPDKAVDLIDEAGAAVRLPAISLPEEIKALQNKLNRVGNELKEAEKINDQIRSASLEKEILETKTILEEKTQSFEKKKSTTTNVVTPEIIQEIISRWTNIPVAKLTEKESDKLVNLEDLIHKRIINQEQAVAAVAEAVRRGRAGLKSGKRPIGSFIFMGPTGVGKTELAKALAEILFGSEELIVRLDMTEYMERHEVAKLIGAPPGYVGYEEGGQLTEAVRRHPYSVVLFDEIEKAHPDVFNILIQLLDDGRLTDNKGHTVSFKNTIVICTSNIGTGLIQQEMLDQKAKEPSDKAQDKPLDKTQDKPKTDESVKTDESKSNDAIASQPKAEELKPTAFDFEALANKLLEELRKFFRPELLNRFDEIIVFRPLSFEHMLKVVDLQTALVGKLLEDQGLGFQISPTASEKLAKLGYDPIYGARPLRRTVQRYIENPISSLIIKGEAKVGDTIVVELNQDEFEFNVKKTKPVQTEQTGTEPEQIKAPDDKLEQKELPNKEQPVSQPTSPQEKNEANQENQPQKTELSQAAPDGVNGSASQQVNSPLSGFYSQTENQTSETPQPITPKTV
ncbi:MAG: AAA family ATPase, partial [Patescibacteria group bacterium]|nr:AAA family ATPase [Patescibacteria group bacterium]